VISHCKAIEITHYQLQTWKWDIYIVADSRLYKTSCYFYIGDMISSDQLFLTLIPPFLSLSNNVNSVVLHQFNTMKNEIDWVIIQLLFVPLKSFTQSETSPLQLKSCQSKPMLSTYFFQQRGFFYLLTPTLTQDLHF
jgi:hypothetical protein